MNPWAQLEFLPPAALSVLALMLASALHHAVLRDLGLLQRRRLYESLALLGLFVALLIALSNIILWRANPGFVVLCSALWATFCGTLIAILRRRRRDDNDGGPLEIPGMQHVAAESPRVASLNVAPRLPLSRARLSPQRLRANLDVYRRRGPPVGSSATGTRNSRRPSRRASA